jgi:hypothetical protein
MQDFINPDVSYFKYIDIEVEDIDSFKHELISADVEFCRKVGKIGNIIRNQEKWYHTEETKDLIRKSAVGRKRSKESCLKQSETVSGSANHFYGKTHSDEFKRAQSLRKKVTQRGELNTNAKKIKYKEEVYGTMKEMSNHLDISLYRIRQLVKTGLAEVL